MEAAWPGLDVEESNLTVQIAALRRALDQEGGGRWIETLPRRGYRYVGPPVTRGDTNADETGHPTGPLLPEKPSIAVLPFEHSGEADWLADGVVDDIITGLSRLRWLFVIARNSSFVWRGRIADVKQVGRDLGVRYVLQGSVRRTGDRVRINAQLADAANGGHIWAERYDRTVGDLFALQDEIALAVVAAIEPACAAPRLSVFAANGPTVSTLTNSWCAPNRTSTSACLTVPRSRSRNSGARWLSIRLTRSPTALPR